MSTFGQRLKVLGKAAVGVFSEDSMRQAHGLLAGALPGGMGVPPNRNTADYLRAYSQMPWLRAVSMRVSTAVASAPWQLFVAKGAGQKARGGGVVKDIQRSGDQKHRKQLLKTLDLDKELQQITDHPLMDVLTKANSFQTGLGMRKVTQTHLDLVGDAFWLKERDAQGTIIGVWPVPPHWIMATPTPAFRFFRVSFKAWRGLIPDTEFLWFSDDDPLNPYARGTGVAQSLGDELETDEYAARHTKAFFYNQARPDLLVWPKGGTGMTAANVKRLEEDWLSNVQGFFRAFKPYFLTREVEVKELAPNFRSMQFVQLRQFERDTILQVFGVPPEILGVLEHSNRATITAADYLMSRYVVQPRLEFMRTCLQERLIPEYDERLIIDYVSPVQEDDDLKLQVATAAPWSLTIDEWRKLGGQPPMEDEDAGAQHMVPTTMAPRTLAIDEKPDVPAVAPGTPQIPSVTPPAADGQAPPKPKPGKQAEDFRWAVAAAAESGDLVLAESLHKATSLDLAALPAGSAIAARQEPAVARALLKAWRDHAASLSLAALRQAVGQSGTTGDVVDALKPSKLAHTQTLALEPQLVTGFLRGADFGASAMRRHGVAVRAAKDVAPCPECHGSGLRPERGMGDPQGQQACPACGGNGRLAAKAGGLVVDLHGINAAAVAWAQAHAGALVDAPADVQQAVRAILVRRLENDISDGELAELLRDTVGLTLVQQQAVLNFQQRLVEAGIDAAARAARVARYADAQRSARALTIARTELISALNGGQQQAWNLAIAQGVIQADQFDKLWIVTDDEALEQECEGLADEQVAIDEAFSSGDLYPPAHPNCRCTIGLVPSGKSATVPAQAQPAAPHVTITLQQPPPRTRRHVLERDANGDALALVEVED